MYALSIRDEEHSTPLAMRGLEETQTLLKSLHEKAKQLRDRGG